jgi:hypothetical protein
MIVGVVVVLAVTLTQLRQLLQSGREFFPGLRGAMAIPTLAIIAGSLATMGSANVDLLKGRSLVFGSAVGIVMLAAMSLIKYVEFKRSRKAQPAAPSPSGRGLG